MPVSSMSSRFSTGIVQVLEIPGKLSFVIHRADERVVRHALRPFAAWLEHDGGVEHIHRRVVGGAVGAPDGAEYALDLREAADDPILLLQEIRSLVIEMPGSAVGMYIAEPSNSGGMNWLPMPNASGNVSARKTRFASDRQPR